MPHNAAVAESLRKDWNVAWLWPVALLTQPMEYPMSKPMKQQEMEEKAKKKSGGQQHPNPPKKTSTDNPERNPRDQKGRGGSK